MLAFARCFCGFAGEVRPSTCRTEATLSILRISPEVSTPGIRQNLIGPSALAFPGSWQFCINAFDGRSKSNLGPIQAGPSLSFLSGREERAAIEPADRIFSFFEGRSRRCCRKFDEPG